VIQKDHAMISAVSGSTAPALLALFGRSPAYATANPSKTTQRATPAALPMPQGTGVTAQSLFDALVQAGDSTAGSGKAGSGAAPLDDLLSSLFASLDTDGDGALSPAELQSALSGLTGTATGDSPQTQTAAPTKSLYESLFNAIAADDGSRASAARKDDLSQKFLSLLVA
jgi:hypothetical protein